MKTKGVLSQSGGSDSCKQVLESQASWDSIQVDGSQVNYCQLSTLLGSSLCRGHQSENGLVSVSFVWLDPSSSLEGHCV